MEMARIVSKAALAALLVGVPALGLAQDAGFGFSPDQASSGTDVPQAEMSLGMRPVANDLIFVAGIKQGFFGDVGIKITPPPYGRKVLFDQAIPLLVNSDINAQTLYPPDVVAALD